MKNKIISIILTLSLLNVQLYAGFFSDSLSSTTPAMDGNVNGQNIYYSGGFSYKIGAGKGIPLLWNIQGPELKVGCGGISFKGMFGSLIDTDALETMLKDAGAALAWGILMGLVYSLPGVADVLAKIQQFARELQKLLANACQMGQSIGKGLANRASNYMEGTDTKWLGDMKKKVDAAKQGINNALDSGMEWMKGLPGDLDDWADEKLPPNEQAGIVGAAIRDVVVYKDFSYSVFRGLRNNLNKNGDITYPSASANKFYEAGTPLPLDLASMESKASSYDEKKKTDHMLKALLLNFKINAIGATTLDEDIVKKIAQFFDEAMENAGSTDEEQKKAKEEMMKNLTTASYDVYKFTSGNLKVGMVMSLLLGKDASTKSKLEGLTSKIAVPKLVPVSISLGKTITESETMDILKVDVNDNDTAVVEHFYNVFNLKKLNTCTFYNAFSTTNNTTLINLLIEQANVIDDNSLTKDNIAGHCADVSQDFGPVLNVYRYINTILQSPKAHQTGLFQKVYSYNLYKMNEAFLSLLNNMYSVDLEINSANSDTIKSDKNLPKLNPISQKAKDRILSEKKQLKEFLDNYAVAIAERFAQEIKDAADIEKLFSLQEKINREEGLKAYGKSVSGQ